MDQSKLTPMMRQYFEMKTEAKDAVLLFRMGDFYEIFGDDALEVAPKLQLALTSRERGDQQKIPFCGVPHHSARGYWLRLVNLGYKIAIADQIEDPKQAKGIVKRKITRMLSPGCVDDPEGLDPNEPNYLFACYQDPKSQVWWNLLADVSTGELRIGKQETFADVLGFVERTKPKEILVRNFVAEEFRKSLQLKNLKLAIETLSEAALRVPVSGNSFQKLEHQAKCLTNAFFAYLDYLKINRTHFTTVNELTEPDTMQLDEIAVRDLELFETVQRRERLGSLFYEINKTLTPMGARLLRDFLLRPLRNAKPIKERLDKVEWLLQGSETLGQLRSVLNRTPDIKRLMTRVNNGYATPSEINLIREALRKAAQIARLLNKSKLSTSSLKNFTTPLEFLENSLVEELAALGSGERIFREGYDPKLDELLTLSKHGQDEVATYEKELREETGINSLKIKRHKTFGLLIEVTKSNLAKVPEFFVRRQTMVNNERFVTEALVELDDRLTGASERLHALENSRYQEFLSELAKHTDRLVALAHAIAEVDVIQSFAWQAQLHDYCRPTVATKVDLKNSRHPVVEHFVGRAEFKPNDICMTQSLKHVLITGPNMAGKSTIMRQLALNAVLHQIGSFVPATAASLPLFDRIFTRIGAADDLSRGQSTFYVEMAETANILSNASANSLVILDEVGRGTSTEDGFAIASSIFDDLVSRIDCFTMFATHFHGLVPRHRNTKNVRLMQTETIKKQDQIVFSHRLIDGASGKSYGIEVAKLAGLPDKVVRKATAILEQKTPKERFTQPVLFDDVPPQQPTDHRFNSLQKRFEGLKIQSTTPLEALNILSDLKEILGPKETTDELFHQ